LFSTKLVPLSFDYFIDAQRGYKDMLTLAEFHTPLIDNWPGALDELRRDPTDLSQSVDSNPSGTRMQGSCLPTIQTSLRWTTGFH
jgi:hypothetical protein